MRNGYCAKGRVGKIFLVAVVVAATLAGANSFLNAGEADKSPAEFTKKNELLRPEGYRTWMFVGTPVTPNDMNNGKAPFPEFHNVYIDQAAYRQYKKTGTFRDGTMLVKELVSVGAKKATSGKGYFQGKFVGLEVSLKDTRRYPKEPGNWAYFRFTPERAGPLKAQAKAMPTSACNDCHQGAAAQDYVFTQYYPVLRAAKPAK